MMGFAVVDDKAYMPITGFTTVELGCERGNNAYTIISKMQAPFSAQNLSLFNQVWNDNAKMQVVTEKVLDASPMPTRRTRPIFSICYALQYLP